jgi:uncharacterized protein YbjT (DUF2867 family)
MSNREIAVLVAWPGSYIGRRLTQDLLRYKDVRVRVLVKDARWASALAHHAAEVAEGDILDDTALKRAALGIDVAYFPLRYLGTDVDFGEFSRVFAERFRDACIEAGVKRIIYLGTLSVEDTENEVINSMEDVGRILSAYPEKIQTVWLRAGFVIGSGSMLSEVLRNLVQKSPVMIVPRWMETKVSFVGIADLLKYLVRAKDVDVQGTFVVDIGLQAMSIREMLLVTSRVMGLKRVFVPIPVEARWLFSLVLTLTSPFSFALSSLFIRILQKVERRPNHIIEENTPYYFQGMSPTPFQTVIAEAVDAIGREQVLSRWTDSLVGLSSAGGEHELEKSLFRDIKARSFGDTPKHKIFLAITSIGGRQGWFSFDILWRIRGFLDKLSGGLGASVGRRVQSELRVGDLLDVWRVVDIQEDRRLLLEAHMNVFGKGWLEFRIEGNTLIQTAYHYPRGIMGRLYWYSMLPFHTFIFDDMIEGIIHRARTL